MREAVTRSMIERSGQAGGLLIGGKVAQFRNDRQPGHQLAAQKFSSCEVGIFQGVLVLRAAYAVLNGQVLHGLHEERDAIDFSSAVAIAGSRRMH